MIYTHKVHGWTRRSLGDGTSRVEVIPTDGSGTRVVRFLSAHSWANDPHDDTAKQGEDRVVLIDGPELPAWALAWLAGANARQCEQSRAALRSALDDADRNSWGGW